MESTLQDLSAQLLTPWAPYCLRSCPTLNKWSIPTKKEEKVVVTPPSCSSKLVTTNIILSLCKRSQRPIISTHKAGSSLDRIGPDCPAYRETRDHLECRQEWVQISHLMMTSRSTLASRVWPSLLSLGRKESQNIEILQVSSHLKNKVAST